MSIICRRRHCTEFLNNQHYIFLFIGCEEYFIQECMRKKFRLGLNQKSNDNALRDKGTGRAWRPWHSYQKINPLVSLKWQNQSEIHRSRCIVQHCLRKTLPEIDMCVIASGLQLVIWAFSPGDRSEWVRGWSLHLLSPLNPSLWSFHSWHLRLWPRSCSRHAICLPLFCLLFKTRHLSSIILSSCSRNAGPWATRSPQGSWKIICTSVVVDEFLACLGIAYNCLDNMSTYSHTLSLCSALNHFQ